MRVLGLPPFLWVDSVFRSIGNHLRSYLETNMSFLQTKDKEMARILVSLNPREGLAENIKIQYKDLIFDQALDYEHLPFRCHRCHAYGHLAKDCPLGIRRRRKQKKADVDTLEVEKGKASGSEVAQELEPMDLDRSKEDKAMEQVHQVVLTWEDVPELPLKPGICAQGSSEDPAVTLLEDTKGMRLESSNTSLFLSLETKDACLNSSAIISKGQILADHAQVDSIIMSIPQLNLNCERVLDKKSEEKCVPLFVAKHYNLCSHDKKPVSMEPVGGLGMDLTLSSMQKPRGRKSNLSKAQVKAKFDMVDGKKMSIPGVLRVVKPCMEEVIK